MQTYPPDFYDTTSTAQQPSNLDPAITSQSIEADMSYLIEKEQEIRQAEEKRFASMMKQEMAQVNAREELAVQQFQEEIKQAKDKEEKALKLAVNMKQELEKLESMKSKSETSITDLMEKLKLAEQSTKKFQYVNNDLNKANKEIEVHRNKIWCVQFLCLHFIGPVTT